MDENDDPRPPLDDTRLSVLFDVVLTRHAGQTVPVGTLVQALHERGFGVLLVLFALPLCIPIPKPPPIDSILGIPLFYLTFQMILGRTVPSLPQKVLDRTLPVDMLIKAFNKGRPYLEKFERLFRPRLTRTFSDSALARICGVLGLFLTISVLFPFPFSNTVPSLCVVVMATGVLARDGLAALLAGLVGVAWVLGLIAAVTMGVTFLV